MTTTSGGDRVLWAELPRSLRSAVEEILGEPVVHAVSQPGGFSPGSADRVLTPSGRRAFVKASSTELNEVSVTLHRREAHITKALSADVPAPELLGSCDDGSWTALILEDVEGRHPRMPWTSGELDAVLSTLTELSTLPLPEIELPEASADLAEDFAGWERLRHESPQQLDPWACEHLDLLEELASHGAAALHGTALLHRDVRADNILLTAEGPVLVDWPWAARGAPWFDALCLLINVNLAGGHDVDDLADTHLHGAPAEAVDAVLSGMTAFFLDASRREPPPGLPTVRSFQSTQGKATLAWLRRRLTV